MTRQYWSLANWIPPIFAGGSMNLTRNTLALICSPDLKNWTVRSVVLQHPDPGHHAFQYVDWLFDGGDLIAVSRTAFDDTTGGAHSAHDANFSTFHRIANFRDRTQMPAADADVVRFSNGDFSVEGRHIDISPLAVGATAFQNRDYVWTVIPSRFSRWSYTRTGGGGSAEISITAKRDTALWAAAANDAKNETSLAGWVKEPDQSLNHGDRAHTSMRVYRRELHAGQHAELLQKSWAGILLLLPPEQSP